MAQLRRRERGDILNRNQPITGYSLSGSSSPRFHANRLVCVSYMTLYLNDTPRTIIFIIIHIHSYETRESKKKKKNKNNENNYYHVRVIFANIKI